MDCHNCGAAFGGDDNYCRGCGIALRPSLPAVRAPGLPAVAWRPLAPSLWQGLAALGLGAALGLLRWALQRRLYPPPARDLPKGWPLGGGETPASIPSPGSYQAFQVTLLVWHRRLVRRR